MREESLIYIEESFMQRTHNVWLATFKDGKKYIAKPVELEFVPEGDALPTPTFVFDQQDNLPKQLKT